MPRNQSANTYRSAPVKTITIINKRYLAGHRVDTRRLPKWAPDSTPLHAHDRPVAAVAQPPHGSSVACRPRERSRCALRPLTPVIADNSSPGPWRDYLSQHTSRRQKGRFAALQSSPSGSRPTPLLSREVNQGVPPPAAAGLEVRLSEVDKPQTLSSSLSARLAAGGRHGRLTPSKSTHRHCQAGDENVGRQDVGASPEINLTKMYARDHDGMVTARALLVGSTKSLTRMVAAARGRWRVEAAKARARMQADPGGVEPRQIV